MLLLYIFIITLSFIECKWNHSCPTKYLKNGRIKYLSEGRIAQFKCTKPYVLVGNNVDVCINGSWQSTNQVCARKDCPKPPRLFHGNVVLTNKKATVNFMCDDNFILVGSPTLYCFENGWNGSVPSCEANSIEMLKPCHFEIDDPMHCHWLLKPAAFKWIVYPMKNVRADSVVDYLPQYDHTLAPHTGGHYLLLIRQNIQPKSNQDWNTSHEAQFISPQFPATINSEKSLCLIFFYYISDEATLKVLINNETIWVNNQSMEREWTEAKINIIQNQPSSFRIIIEGMKGMGHRSVLAIDDLKLDTNGACNNSKVLPYSSESVQYTMKSSPHTALDQSTTDTSNTINTEFMTTKGTVAIKNNGTTSDLTTTVIHFTELTNSDLAETIDSQDTSIKNNTTEIVPPTIMNFENNADHTSNTIASTTADSEKMYHSSISSTTDLAEQNNVSMIFNETQNTSVLQETKSSTSPDTIKIVRPSENTSGSMKNSVLLYQNNSISSLYEIKTEPMPLTEEIKIPTNIIETHSEANLHDSVNTARTIQYDYSTREDKIEKPNWDREGVYQESINNNYDDYYLYDDNQEPNRIDIIPNISQPTYTPDIEDRTIITKNKLIILLILLLLTLPVITYYSKKFCNKYTFIQKGGDDGITFLSQRRESVVELISVTNDTCIN